MKLLTIYSPTHRSMFEEFLKPSAFEFEIVARETTQIGSGVYLNPNWHDAMSAKVDFLCEQIERLQGEVFVFADADVQLFPPVREFLNQQLGDADIAFQDDITSCCAGFFVARASDRLASLYSQLRGVIRNFRGEQDALNSLLHTIRWKKLPSSVFTVGMATKGDVWTGQPVDIPTNLKVHHANYTIGVEQKMWLLQFVQNTQLKPTTSKSESIQSPEVYQFTARPVAISNDAEPSHRSLNAESAFLPRITLVTPSFNQCQFLDATIRSVRDQQYPNLEHIVIDGGSTDSSVELIRNYESHLSYWCSEKDRGQCDAINKGFARSTGEIMGWLNSDDTLEPGALWTVARYFSKHIEWDGLTGGAYAIDQDGDYLDHNSHALLAGSRPDRSIRRCPKPRGSECFSFWTRDWFPQPATFWRRRVWDQIGPLDENLHYSMDYELWRRVCTAGEIYSIPEVLANCRYHADCKTIREIWGPLKEVVAVNAAQMSESEFRKFGVEVTEWLIQRLQSLEQRKAGTADELQRVLQSPTYRLGKWLARPWSFLKKATRTGV